ncbi:type I-E CRISPR-associated protein Cas6/Cse3/CasE [Nocardia aurantia]|uniref:CRISPR-associated endoribonuclease Cse3 n=1 Tax=Nocardia aurantia TaxID=2585199 RepID=A0A7K0DSZ5_9NOCA|nr:type I-E CRISPR-associated protein Cas6/Cse3/CasE [Nocardia aurantia]MQY28895.1 CRISPR-associated endoribonuclease Cse3 [Nocardia aurantia]
MTYLSRIRINPQRAHSRKLLSNPRAMRSAVLHGIPDDALGERILWRLDTDNPHRPQLYALTRTKPDWKHLVETAGWPDADGEHAQIADYRPLLDRLATGDQYAFRVTTSPIQNTRTPDKLTRAQAERAETSPTERKRPRSLRLGHRTAAAQLGWFLGRTENWGFRIPATEYEPQLPGIDLDEIAALEVRISARQRVSFGRTDEDGRRAPHPVTLHTATFEGHLQVTDAERFATVLLAGIGPSKAYGCGLLTLAPLVTA